MLKRIAHLVEQLPTAKPTCVPVQVHQVDVLELARAKQELERIARECGASKAVACAIASKYFHRQHFETSTPCVKI